MRYNGEDRDEAVEAYRRLHGLGGGDETEEEADSLFSYCCSCGQRVDDRAGWTHCSGGGPLCGDRCPDCGPSHDCAAALGQDEED